MSVPFLLTAAQMRRIRPHFPLSHGVPRVDDRRVLSGIILVIKGGLRWRDAPPSYGPHKTLYNRIVRFVRLKDWRRIATRYDRCPTIFFGAITIAAIVTFWLGK